MNLAKGKTLAARIVDAGYEARLTPHKEPGSTTPDPLKWTVIGLFQPAPVNINILKTAADAEGVTCTVNQCKFE